MQPNFDEFLYRIHIYVMEPLWSFVTFQWVFRDSAAAQAVAEGSLTLPPETGFVDRWFVSPLYHAFSSRPSVEHDSIQEYLNPSVERSLAEHIQGILLGTGDKESVFFIISTSFLFG